MFSKYEKLLKTINREGFANPSDMEKANPKKGEVDAMRVTFYSKTQGDYQAIVTCEGKKGGNVVDFKSNMKPEPMFDNIAQQDMMLLKHLINEDDAIDICDSVVDDCIYEIGVTSPYYRAMLDNLEWEETDNNHPCNTLAVGYDKKIKKFTLYYNPSFILEGALMQYLYAPQDYKSLKDCYKYMLKFYLIHEMSHITREHFSTELQEVSPENVNLLGDYYINQTIANDILGQVKSIPPVIGITNKLSFNKAFKKPANGGDLLSGIKRICKNISVGDSVYIHSSVPYSKASYAHFDKDEEVIIQFETRSDFFDLLNVTNSSTFIQAVNAYLEYHFKEPPYDDSQDGQQGNSQSGDSQGGDSQSGNSQGGGSQDGQQGDPQSGNSQGGGSQGNQQGNSQSGDSNFDKAKKQLNNNEKVKNDAKNKSEEAIEKQEQENNVSQDDKKLASDKEISQAITKQNMEDSNGDFQNKKLGIDDETLQAIKSGSNNKGKWRTLLSKSIAKASGVAEKWDSNSPSARIQGEFGREVEVPSLKNILITIDCSGSMGAEQFKKILSELQEIKSLKKSKPTVHVIYWGDKAVYKKYKFDSNLFSNIKKECPDLGGTKFKSCIDLMFLKIKNPELIIHCTDGEFFDSTLYLQELKGKLMKYNRKSIWVVPPSYGSEGAHYLKMVDPQFTTRLIKIK